MNDAAGDPGASRDAGAVRVQGGALSAAAAAARSVAGAAAVTAQINSTNTTVNGNVGTQVITNQGEFVYSAGAGHEHLRGSADAAKNAVAGGANASHKQGGVTARPTASSKKPGLMTGAGGLPFIGHDLFPLEAKDNTEENAERIHSYAFVFAPNRKKLWDTKVAPLPENFKATVKNIDRLRGKVLEQGRILRENRVYANFSELRLRADGVAVNNIDRVNQFIDSNGLMDLFREHILLPFGLIFWIFHKDTSSVKLFDEWFPIEFRQWMRTNEETPLDFDLFVTLDEDQAVSAKKKKSKASSKSKEKTPKAGSEPQKSKSKEPKKQKSESKEPKKVTNSLVAVAKGAAVKCFNDIEAKCDARFGMHIGVKKKSTDEAKKKYYTITINLGRLNPQDVKTYLFVLRSRYPQLAFHGRDPTIQDLYNDKRINVTPCALPAFQLALAAANDGKTEDEAVEILRNMYKLGKKKGAPLIPPPAEIDAQAKAAAFDEGKRAALLAADGHLQGHRRIAVKNKTGPGWTVDGEIDGVDNEESQTKSAGNHSLLKHPHAYQQNVGHPAGVLHAASHAAATTYAASHAAATTYDAPGVYRSAAPPVCNAAQHMKTPRGRAHSALNAAPPMKTPQGNAREGLAQGPSNAMSGFSPIGLPSNVEQGMKELLDVNQPGVNKGILDLLGDDRIWYFGSPSKSATRNNNSGAAAGSTTTTGPGKNFASTALTQSQQTSAPNNTHDNNNFASGASSQTARGKSQQTSYPKRRLRIKKVVRSSYQSEQTETGANEKEDPAPEDTIDTGAPNDEDIHDGKDSGVDDLATKACFDVETAPEHRKTPASAKVGSGEAGDEGTHDDEDAGIHDDEDAGIHDDEDAGDNDMNGDGESKDEMNEDVYEVECLVGVKWAKHERGVEKGKKAEHLFRARWKGYASDDDTWEPLTNLKGEEIISDAIARAREFDIGRKKKRKSQDAHGPEGGGQEARTHVIPLDTAAEETEEEEEENVTLTGDDWFFCWMYGINGGCTASLCGRCKRHLETHEEHYDKHANSQVMIDSRKRAKKNAADHGKPKAGNGNGEGMRRTRRPTGPSTTEKVKTTARDCEHDNPDCWHKAASKEYSDPKWRRRTKCRPSLRCSNCKEFV